MESQMSQLWYQRPTARDLIASCATRLPARIEPAPRGGFPVAPHYDRTDPRIQKLNRLHREHEQALWDAGRDHDACVHALKLTVTNVIDWAMTLRTLGEALAAMGGSG